MMNVYVNGVKYGTKSGTINIKRRFGSSAVLISSAEEDEPRVISAVDVLGRFLVREGHNYDVFTFQADTPLRVAEGRLKQAKMVERSKREARRFRNSEVKLRRTSNYSMFVKQFIKSFLNVAFSDAAKEWRAFREIDKRTASTETLIDIVRAQGNYQAVLQ